MKKGFTILELLVASLLLGMLMTILTMIFNQSSISWRIGEASVANLDTATKGISDIRYEADNFYAWNNSSYALLSPWDENGDLRKRAISVSDAGTVGETEKIKVLPALADTTEPNGWSSLEAGDSQPGEGRKVYTVNVKSAGPDREFGTYDDIWSFPDDFD